uniref:Ovule protein n=1 Tax=Steinernema glaseri TaxID=37863 RepID=A0A1I7YTB7_9BILA
MTHYSFCAEPLRPLLYEITLPLANKFTWDVISTKRVAYKCMDVPVHTRSILLDSCFIALSNPSPVPS